MLKRKIKEGHMFNASQEVLTSPAKSKFNRSKSAKKGVKVRKSIEQYNDIGEAEDLLGEI